MSLVGVDFRVAFQRGRAIVTRHDHATKRSGPWPPWKPSMSVRSHQSAPGPIGRVEMWRGGSRFGLSVAAPFVWRCPSTLTVAPFPHPARRTGHADRPHPALGQDFTPSHTPGCAAARGQAYETVVPVEVREWIGPAPASPDLVLVAQPPA